MSKSAKILKHLQLVGKIDPMTALQLYNSYRLADVIFKLRKKGFPIETNIIEYTNNEGDTVRYAEYTMQQEVEEG